jgi:hypothetical protein
VRCPFTTCASCTARRRTHRTTGELVRDPLHPNERGPSRRRGQRHPRAGRGPLRSFCPAALPQSSPPMWRATRA